MEKKSWLWKRKSSDKSPGETESSGSISSHSERYSDEQEALKESPSHNTLSPEVTSKVAVTYEEANDIVKSLMEKLSAALVNVGAKEDLVKQHAKVAEEAVAGWEKAENEMVVLKQQLEVAVQQNLALEVRLSHLDGALKECVRQLRQAREEQEQRIHQAVAEKSHEWESTKVELESQLFELQAQTEATKAGTPASIDPGVHLKVESLEKENSVLRVELLSQLEELEIRTIERDLSTQAAETASKQQLESIKKVAKLKTECRRLQAVARKSSLASDHKTVAASSLYVESLTDSHSDSGERLSAVEIDTGKMSRVETSEGEASCSDSWASALIAELDQFKNGKTTTKNLTSCSVDIDIMDDFLEMERLAALPGTKSKTNCIESEAVSDQSNDVENSLRAELDTMGHKVVELEDKLEKMEAEKAELDTMSHKVVQLEDKLEKIEAEKAELEKALVASDDSLEASKAQLTETENILKELQKELAVLTKSKELLEFQLMGTEVEARTMSENVDSLKAEVKKEHSLSADMAVKCQELKDMLTRKDQEAELQQAASTSSELKVKQEDIAVAAGKLAECQKTIASLGRQLKSLASLEDFLLDTPNLPGSSGAGSLIPRASGEPWKLHSNDTFMPKTDPYSSKPPKENSGPSVNGNNEESPPSSSSSTSLAVTLNHVGSGKSKNGFGKLFSRSKSGIQLENPQG